MELENEVLSFCSEENEKGRQQKASCYVLIEVLIPVFSHALLPQGATLLVTLRCHPSGCLSVCPAQDPHPTP